MKKFLAALSMFLAVAAPAAYAQAPAPVPPAPAAADPAALAAANEMLASMNYRAIAKDMMAQMRQTMPAMMQQGAAASIERNPNMDAAAKKAALDKMKTEMPKALAALDSVFTDPTVLDEMMRETANLYARHFTVTELRQIAAFYKTPVGAKMLTSMPQLMTESMQMGQRVIMPHIAAVMQKMQAKK